MSCCQCNKDQENYPSCVSHSAMLLMVNSQISCGYEKITRVVPPIVGICWILGPASGAFFSLTLCQKMWTRQQNQWGCWRVEPWYWHRLLAEVIGLLWCDMTVRRDGLLWSTAEKGGILAIYSIILAAVQCECNRSYRWDTGLWHGNVWVSQPWIAVMKTTLKGSL